MPAGLVEQKAERPKGRRGSRVPSGRHQRLWYHTPIALPMLTRTVAGDALGRAAAVPQGRLVMKRVMLGICMALALAASVAAVGSGDQDFTLINKTGLSVDELYLSPSNDNEWGEDVLGVDVLEDGQKVSISFSHKESECMWDMKIVDEDEDDIIWEDINLCKASQITLYYKGGKPTAEIK